MDQHRSIEEYGLQRSEEGISRYLDSFDCLVPFSGPTRNREWHFRRVFDSQPSERVEDLHKYAYNPLKKAYVVFEVFLEDDEGNRFTEMRFWQMFRDSWMVSGNSPDSLRFVAFANIVNKTVRGLFREEWTYQESQTQGQREYGTPEQRILTIISSNSTTWDRNPFIRSGVRIAESLSTATRPLICEKAHLIRLYGVVFYLVLEFKNGDRGQENYRERLMRILEPMISHNLEQKQAARAAGQEWEDIIFLPPQMQPGRDNAN